MQGVVVFPDLADTRQVSAMMSSIAGSQEKDINPLADSGLHVAVNATWFVYCIGNVRRRDARLP